MARPRVAVLFERFGPYHLARLNAAAQQVDLQGVEFSGIDRTYAWAPTGGQGSFPRHLISDDIGVDPTPRLIRRTAGVLRELRPDAVAIPGWSHHGARAALLWCARSRTPAVLMSDSTFFDEVRRPWKEAVKRRLVALFGGALVAGRPHRAYVLELGMAPERVFDGYDVVDNDHFARRADATRRRAPEARCRLGLPERYFLASCRFVEKKNLFRLLEAFELYRGQAGTEACDLVLLGDGRLRPQLLQWLAQHHLQAAVHMPGFQQYGSLPAYYGLAEAFVHASTTEQWGLVVNEAMAAGLPVLVSNRCGCASDLVIPGVTGYSFDPLEPSELAGLMLRVASNGGLRQKLARAGRLLIAEWSAERFARNLRRAVDAACAAPACGRAADRLLIRALMARRERTD